MGLSPNGLFFQELRASLATPSKLQTKHPDRVESLLSKLITSGANRLQYVVDFDQTLTRAHRDGVDVDCSWGVLENSPLLPSDYTTRSNALKSKYLPIEHDPHMTTEEKVPHIVEWYKKTNQLLQVCGLKRDMIPKLVEASSVELREGTEALLGGLVKSGVPVLVLSAGVGDLVVQVQHVLNAPLSVTVHITSIS